MPSQRYSHPFNLWRRLIDARRGRPLGNPSCHERLDLAPISEGIGLPLNGWWSQWSLHRGVLVDNMCQHHICGKAAQGAWIDAPECSLWLCRDCPAGHPECGCEAHYTNQPRRSSRPQCEIRTGRAVQIILNQRHLWTASTSSHIPSFRKKENPLTSHRHTLSWCCNYCNCFTWHSLLSVELQSSPPNEKKKETQLQSRGVVSLFNYLFNTACIMSII